MYRSTHIHFVGIGGIGMSAIAYMLKKMGHTVSGCDIALNTAMLNRMASYGIQAHQGHNGITCNDATIDYVVYSSDVPRSLLELQRAEKRGILIHRSQMLAELMRSKYGIAISGSHGKTTTTALIAHIFTQAGLDPSYVIGGYLHENGTNAYLGTSKFFIAEADESDRSFLNLNYSIAVVTNISNEHLNVYHTIEEVQATFKQFLQRLPFYGKAIVCIDDHHVASLYAEFFDRSITYGLSSVADFSAYNITLCTDFSTFILRSKLYAHESLVHVGIPGAHNVLNTLAAIAVAHQAEIALEDVLQAVRTFKGVDRRFSFRGRWRGAEIFDDYGHHPREIACTLAVAGKRTKNKLIVVFQPHRFTRTHALWHDFITLFSQIPIDHLFIVDIYSAHEDPLPNVTSSNLVQAIRERNPEKSVSYIDWQEDDTAIQQALSTCIQPEDLVLFLGAGSIYAVSQRLQASENQLKSSNY